MNIVRLNSQQLGEVVSFIVRLQADKTHQIAYFGDTAAEIAALIQTFEPPHNVLLAYEAGQLVGLLGIDTDAETGRAWLYGPMVDFADWATVADALYEEALRQDVMPPFVRDEELFVDVANTNIAAFAGRHRFIPGTPNASLRLERTAFSTESVVSDVEELTALHYQTFNQLHVMLFPGTYFSGRQIIDRLGVRDKVFIASIPEMSDVPVAYIYARIEPEATEGYIDFLGVHEGFRRRGIGGRLISAAARWLFSFPDIEVVALTVHADNTAAIALYTGLGFTHTQTLQSFRKRY
jgi:ribosomal protein S18 acetylase RimI-like enzyme